jgi:hypothetical protein
MTDILMLFKVSVSKKRQALSKKTEYCTIFIQV